MSDASKLSDKALAVFAFAAYHQLTGGQPVLKVILRDGSGHKADDDAVRELEAAGLASTDDDHVVFSESGLKRLASVVDSLRA